MAKQKTANPKAPAKGKTAEEKAAKFRDLGAKRTMRARKAIRAIGNLGGSGYVSTQEQRDKIISALNEAVDEVRRRLSGGKASDTFEL